MAVSQKPMNHALYSTSTPLWIYRSVRGYLSPPQGGNDILRLDSVVLGTFKASPEKNKALPDLARRVETVGKSQLLLTLSAPVEPCGLTND